MVLSSKKTNTRTDSERKKVIEQYRKKLDGHSLDGTRRVTLNDIDFSNFSQWSERLANVTDPDKARGFFYFGFQPLYDLLISDSNLSGNREEALAALDKTVQAGIEYLTGYYTGEPKIGILNQLGKDLAATMDKLKGQPFVTKFRNVDYNGIYPNQIKLYLERFSDFSLDGKLFVPDYVVGCACGSSEIVMPLAGVSDSNLGFIRRSWRRGDDSPKVIKEQKAEIKENSENKAVVCVEDYVCSGKSLYKVMKYVSQFEPRKIIGSAVNGDDPSALKMVHSERKFKLLEL